VRISGFEEWMFGDDGLVAESKGRYDQTEASVDASRRFESRPLRPTQRT